MKNILRQANVSLFPFVNGMFYRLKTEMKEGRRPASFCLAEIIVAS